MACSSLRVDKAPATVDHHRQVHTTVIGRGLLASATVLAPSAACRRVRRILRQRERLPGIRLAQPQLRTAMTALHNSLVSCCHCLSWAVRRGAPRIVPLLPDEAWKSDSQLTLVCSIEKNASPKPEMLHSLQIRRPGRLDLS